MRLTTVIILASLLQVSAATFGQKVTLNQQNATLKSIFKEIRKQTGYDFVFDGQLSNLKSSIQLTDGSIDQAMQTVLSKHQLSYNINDNLVIIKKNEKPTLLDNLIARFQQIDVRGRVVDETGKGLPGVTIRMKNGKSSTISSADGNFELKNVDEGAVVVFTYIGFDAKEVAASKDMGLVKLQQATSKLDEVQIQAYGITSRRLSTSNISTVTAADIQKQPVNNPILALQGRAPGITIEQSTGIPGSGITIRVQGLNSIGRGYDPLYIIDGVPYTSTVLVNLNTIRGGSGNPGQPGQISGGASPLSFINPADIESIDVLKDAAATSIYGSRAAAGAVIITTKKGKAGPAKIDFNVQNGWQRVGRKMKLMNTDQYLEMRREAKTNDNLPEGTNFLGGPDYDLLGKYGWSLTRSTDWQKELLGNTAHFTQATGSISGGSVNTQLLLSANYSRETSVFPTSLSDTKASVHFNVNHSAYNNRLKVQFTATYLADKNQLPFGDLTSSAMQIAPNAPALYNTDGSLNWAPDENGNSTWANPLATSANKSVANANNLTSNASITYDIFKGLSFKTALGFNSLQTNEIRQVTLLSYAPELRPVYGNNGRSSHKNVSSINYWNIEPQLSFKKSIGKGKLDALIGTTFSKGYNTSLGFMGTGYSSDQLLGDLAAAANKGFFTDYTSVYKYNAVFGIINYSWDNKYILDLTGRRDGSSRFGSENLFHNFGSVGAGWIFSEESFIKEKTSFFSFGKLKASYGTTGNDQIGDYQFLSLYNSVNTPVPYQGIVGLAPNALPNPYLQWEETQKLNIGLDLGFFQDRLLINVNRYKNTSSNQLLSYHLAPSTGFNDITQNFPATVQNSGWEMSLNTDNIRTKQFNWTTNFNISFQKNKLVAFPDIENSSYASSLVIGQPVNLVKAFHFLGVNPQTGLYEFMGRDGHPTSSPKPYYFEDNDAIVNIDPNPDFFGGFENNFTFKGLTLSTMFQFVKQNALNSSAFGSRFVPGSFFSNNGTTSSNQPAFVLDRWQKLGDEAFYQKYNSTRASDVNTAYSAAGSSDAAYDNASYIRLKNVSLSYQFSSNWMNIAHLKGLRIYAQAQNLLTITKYRGLDPETKSSSALPPLKVITVGIHVTF